jgi:SET domain-containing protein
MTYQPTKAQKAEKLTKAIDLLNEIVKIQLQPSAIHGVGVFALRDIKKGETLYADTIPHQFDIPLSKFKKLLPYIREIILGHFPLITQGSHFMYPVTKMTAFLNHSDTPNYDAKKDVALRKIKAGEEVTEDYHLIPGWEQVYPWLTKV